MKLDHFAPTPGQNGTPCAIFAPNILLHCINVVQAVSWLIWLTDLRLAQIIKAMKNNDSNKIKHS